MAYEVAYFTEYLDAGAITRIEIFQRDYAGDPMEIGLSGPQPYIKDYDNSDDVFQAIRSRYAIINVENSEELNLGTILFDSKTRYMVRILRDEVLDYLGYLTPFETKEALKPFGDIISLRFTDGLKFLKGKKYEKPPAPTRRISLKDLICEAIKQVGFPYELNIYIGYNTYEDNMDSGDGDCPLAQMEVDTWLYTDEEGGLDYYTILTDILTSRNLRLSQKDGRWYVLAVHELANEEIKCRIWSVDGDYIGPYTYNNEIKPLGKTEEVGFLDPADTSILEPLFKQVVTFDYVQLPSLLLNGDFKTWMSGVPINWTKKGVWTDLVLEHLSDEDGGGLKIKGFNPDSVLSPVTFLESDVMLVQGPSNYLVTGEVQCNYSKWTAYITIEAWDSENVGNPLYPKMYLNKNGQWVRTRSVVYFEPDALQPGQDSTTPRAISFSIQSTQDINYSLPQYYNRMQVNIRPGRSLVSGEEHPDPYIIYRNISITETPAGFTAKNKRITTPTESADIVKEQWIGLVNDNDFNFEGEEVKVMTGDHPHQSVLGGTFITGTETKTKLWRNFGDDVSGPFYQKMIQSRMRILAKFNSVVEGRLEGSYDVDQRVMITSTGKTYLILQVREYDVLARRGEVTMVEFRIIAADEMPAHTIKKYTVGSDGSSTEVLNPIDTPTTRTPRKNTANKDFMDTTYSENEQGDSMLEIGMHLAKIIGIGNDISQTWLFGKPLAIDGNFYMNKFDGEDPLNGGLNWVDGDFNITDFIKPSDNGFLFKSEAAPWTANLKMDTLEENVDIDVSVLSSILSGSWDMRFKLIDDIDEQNWIGFNIDDRFRMGILDDHGRAGFQIVYDGFTINNLFDNNGRLTYRAAGGEEKKYLIEGEASGGSGGVSGDINYLSKFITPGTLGNSQVYDNGVLVGIGVAGVWADYYSYTSIRKDTPNPYGTLALVNAAMSDPGSFTSTQLRVFGNNSGSQINLVGVLSFLAKGWTYGTYLANSFNLLSTAAGGLGLRAANAPINFYAGNSDADNSPLIASMTATATRILALAGSGTRMVTVSSDGTLGHAGIPSGGGGGVDTDDQNLQEVLSQGNVAQASIVLKEIGSGTWPALQFTDLSNNFIGRLDGLGSQINLMANDDNSLSVSAYNGAVVVRSTNGLVEIANDDYVSYIKLNGQEINFKMGGLETGYDYYLMKRNSSTGKMVIKAIQVDGGGFLKIL